MIMKWAGEIFLFATILCVCPRQTLTQSFAPFLSFFALFFCTLTLLYCVCISYVHLIYSKSRCLHEEFWMENEEFSALSTHNCIVFFIGRGAAVPMPKQK